jgi:hypothetical protein
MAGFGPECQHVVVNGTGPVTPNADRPYIQQAMLRQLLPDAFPPLYPLSAAGKHDSAEGGIELVQPVVHFP